MRRTSTLAIAGATVMALVTGLAPLPAMGADSTESRPKTVMTRAKDAVTRAGDTLKHAGETAPRFAPAQPIAVEEFAVVAELKPFHFEFDQAQVRAADARIMDANAEWLKANPTVPVLVQGYADERGATEYNLRLAERRAMAVRDQLIGRGIPAERISIVTYGEGRPACRTRNEMCWGESRRVDLMVRNDNQQRP